MKIITKTKLSSMGYCNTVCLTEYISNCQNSNEIKLYTKELHSNEIMNIMNRPKTRTSVNVIITRGLKLRMKENADSKVHYN